MPPGPVAATGRRSPSRSPTPGTGRGLGSALAGRLVEHARRSGLSALTASTLSENGASHALLRRLGFVPAGVSSGVAEYELAFGAALPAAA